MLTIRGDRETRFCDGYSRRSFLRIGGYGLGASLVPCWRSQASAAGIRNDRAIIIVYLPGGPPQHETFDPKPGAPAEIRGSFRSTATSIPGVHFCELLPRLAQAAHTFSVVRTLTGMYNRHESYQCYTGRPGGRTEDNEPAGGWPSLGSTVSTLLGQGRDGAAAYIDAAPKMSYGPYNNAGMHDGSGKISWPGFTGLQHCPFTLEGEVKSDLVLNGVNGWRLEGRRALLDGLDRMVRRSDGINGLRQQAFDLLTTGRLVDALDLERETPEIRERYGVTQETNPAYGGAPQSPSHLLLARRLVEAGVRCVTVAFGAWDWHGTNREGTLEHHAKKYLPTFDRAFSAFFLDLHERQLLERVTVVVWGEFGRTPRINQIGGRDHWPSTQSILLAGGGIQGGRVVGGTDKIGGSPMERPVHVQEVFATLYHNLGIDVNMATVADFNGRPRYLVDENRQPISELY